MSEGIASWAWLVFWSVATISAVIHALGSRSEVEGGEHVRRVHVMRSREWRGSALPWVFCLLVTAAFGFDATNELMASPSLLNVAKMLALSSISVTAFMRLWQVGR